MTGELLPLAETPVPTPNIQGPLFEQSVGAENNPLFDLLHIFLKQTQARLDDVYEKLVVFAGVADVTEQHGNESANNRADVEALQKFLVSKGYKGTPIVDGVAGTATVEAIKAFQRAVGLKADGKCGPKTKAAVVAPQFDTEPHADASPGEQTACLRCQFILQAIVLPRQPRDKHRKS